MAAAAARGVEGFVRALAKEIGRRGATANLLYLARRAGDEQTHLLGPLRFFCGNGTAYATGQALTVTSQVSSHSHALVAPRLAGEVALVTGESRGIGAAAAMRLAREGAKVICADLAVARDPLYELARKLGGSLLVLDLTATRAPEYLAGSFATSLADWMS
jgi:3-oxoacyl-[acyl-carrier protein] reductase